MIDFSGKLYSFDVFDTLITRKTAVPKGIFDLVEHGIKIGSLPFLHQISPDINYAETRIKSEQLAREKNRCRGLEEINLVEIYDVFRSLTGVDFKIVDCLMEYELQVEKENIIGIRRNIGLLKQLLEQKKRVILISDMYMSATEIRNILVAVDSIFRNIPIYVSSDYRMTKFSGRIFKAVREVENIEYGAWYHFGDNVHSDVNVPSELGIHAVHLAYKDLWNIEKKFLNMHYKEVDVQYSIGQARYLRYMKNYSYAFEFGCTVAGYLMLSYVKWIFFKCQDMGIKRLYFIARDGYIPYIVASLLVDEMDLDIQVKYIYGSRHAWRMAAFDGTGESLRRLILSYIPTTVDELAYNLQISQKVLNKYLPYSKYVNGNLTLHDLHDCISLLCQNKEFLDNIYKNQTLKRKMVQDYLVQEIDTSDNSFAFVDTRGTGYTQECMAKIFSDYCVHPLRTFALYMGGVGDESVCRFENLFYKKCELEIEALFQAPHGSTIGYCRKYGKIQPLLNKEGEFLISYAYEQYIEGIREFVLQALKNKAFISQSVNEKTVEEWKNNIVENIQHNEMRFLNEMPCEPIKFKQREYTMLLSELEGKRIILYGAGKFGKIIYSKIRNKKNIQLVAWLDKNYEKLYPENPQLSGTVEYAMHKDYDTFLIAITDVNGDVHNYIVSKGVPEEKILDLV